MEEIASESSKIREKLMLGPYGPPLLSVQASYHSLPLVTLRLRCTVTESSVKELILVTMHEQSSRAVLWDIYTNKNKRCPIFVS